MKNKIEIIVLVVIVAILLFSTIFKIRIRRRTINIKAISRRWDNILKKLTDKTSWHTAILDADEILDEVLKKKKYQGKTTGERLVSAQHDLTDNEMVWYSHKLKTKIVEQNYTKPNKTETVNALSGFKNALVDLGAMSTKNNKPNKLKKATRKKKATK